MNLVIPYGKDELNTYIAKKNVLDIVYPNEVEEQDEYEILQKAIENPIDSKSFKNFLSDADDILIIVNDGTRPTPTEKVLDVIDDYVKNKNLKFLVATGVHNAPSNNDLHHMFGIHYRKFRDRIYVHDSKEATGMVYLGTSRNGTELWINKLALDVNKIIAISSIEPHYFAGYTGGRKSFLPGIAGYKTIEQNHRFAMTSEARLLALESNPVHQDMVDFVSKIDDEKIFTIQTVLNRAYHIYRALAGHIHRAFDIGTRFAQEVFCIKIKGQADIVVTIVRPPFDIELYQTLKAIENGKACLKKGGVLIVVSPCAKGIGPENFARLFKNSKSMERAVRHSMSAYQLGDHNAANLVKINDWASLWAVTNIDDAIMKKGHIRPFHSLQDAIDMATKTIGLDAKILFLMDGSLIVPVLN